MNSRIIPVRTRRDACGTMSKRAIREPARSTLFHPLWFFQGMFGAGDCTLAAGFRDSAGPPQDRSRSCKEPAGAFSKRLEAACAIHIHDRCARVALHPAAVSKPGKNRNCRLNRRSQSVPVRRENLRSVRRAVRRHGRTGRFSMPFSSHGTSPSAATPEAAVCFAQRA